MKIILLTDWFCPIGGIESFVYSLARKLGQNHPEVEIRLLVNFIGDERPILDFEKCPNLKLVDISDRPYAKIKQQLNEFQPDILHINGITARTLWAVRTAQKRQIAVVDTRHQTTNYQTNWLKKYQPTSLETHRTTRPNGRFDSCS